MSQATSAASEGAASEGANSDGSNQGAGISAGWTAIHRIVAWTTVTLMAVFLLNVFLIFRLEWPGIAPVLALFGIGESSGELDARPVVQFASYVGAILAVCFLVFRTPQRTLRADSELLGGFVTYVIRASFWAVLLVGLADALVSFLRVEELLPLLVGQEMTTELGRSSSRGPLVHLPLIALSLAIAAFTRGIGFHWLALLVVLAELVIVLSRFIYSYEQAFQGDLVRFWYAALFLFASAYTLVEDGHVRVDVIYAGMAQRYKGLVNAIGSMVMGVSLCWVILLIGFEGKSSIMTSPLLNYEVSQSGFGMYVKYWMAAFLTVFAVAMLIQFCSYYLSSVADWRNEKGHKEGVGAIS